MLVMLGMRMVCRQKFVYYAVGIRWDDSTVERLGLLDGWRDVVGEKKILCKTQFLAKLPRLSLRGL